MSNFVERIIHEGRLLAIILGNDFRDPGIHFFTEADLSQQLAFMRHPAGTMIAPHVHRPVPREVHYTQEVLIVKRGRLLVDLYDHTCHYLETRILKSGDVIMLISGGHGFEVIEEVEMIEVKQGPYAGELDKIVFLPNDQPNRRFR